MLRDRFDQIIIALLVVVLAFSAVLLTGAVPADDRSTAAFSRQLEREIAYQARISYLERHYQPVLELRTRAHCRKHCSSWKSWVEASREKLITIC